MVWNDFTITVAAIVSGVIIEMVCDSVVKYRKNKIKPDEKRNTKTEL